MFSNTTHAIQCTTQYKIMDVVSAGFIITIAPLALFNDSAYVVEFFQDIVLRSRIVKHYIV